MIQKFSYHWFRISALQTTTLQRDIAQKQPTAPPQRQHGVPKSSSSAPSGPSRFEASPWPAAFAPRLFFFFRSDWWHKGYTDTTDSTDAHTHMMYNWYTKDIKSDAHLKYRRYTWNTHEKQINYLGVILMFFHVGQVCFALSLRPGVLLPPVRLEALMPMSHDAVQPPRSPVIISYIYIYYIYSNQSTTVFLMVHVNSWDSQKPVHPESLLKLRQTLFELSRFCAIGLQRSNFLPSFSMNLLHTALPMGYHVTVHDIHHMCFICGIWPLPLQLRLE